MNDISSQPAPGRNSALDDFLGRKADSPRARLVRRGGLALTGLLVLWLLYHFTFGRADTSPHYATTAAHRGELLVSVSATGNLQPTNEVEVGSELSGLVTDVNVDNNDRVTRNQVLAKLDTSRLQDAIVQGQAALQSAQASVAQAHATEQQARATLARYQEVRQLSNGKVPSSTEMDTAQADLARAIAAVATAQAQVAQARAQLSSDQTSFSKASIRSPVTGVVLSRQIDPGQTVAASFNAPVLFLIAEDLSKMRLDVKVDEADVGEVDAGQKATFQVDAFPGRTFPARVERVDVGANASGTSGTSSSTSSGSSGSSNTVVAYTAVLSVDNAEGILRPGMTATAEIVTNEKRNVLLVPNAALRFNPNAAEGGGERSGVTKVLLPGPPRGTANQQKRQVGIGRGSEQNIYVLGADGQPKRVVVKTGDTNGVQTEVTSGELKEGDAVITGQLAAGAKAASASGGRRGGGN